MRPPCPVRLVASLLLAALAVPVAALTIPAAAQTPGGWSSYVTPSGATALDFPQRLFSRKAGPAQEGSGETFRTSDGRAELIVYELDNADRDTPAAYLRKHLIFASATLHYRRISDSFFAISGIRNSLTFYSRCNFSGGRGLMHCIYVAYPQQETHAWDAAVTRLSHSLRDSGAPEARRRGSD